MTHSMLRPGAVILGVLFGASLAGVFAWALETQSYNVWGAVVVVPVIVLLNAVVICRVSQRAREEWLPKVLGIALGAKLAGTLVRYAVAYVGYGGVADAERYNLYGATHYTVWRQGIIFWDWAGAQGTHYMELITTAVYALIGPSPLAGFVVFASLAFWGQYLLFRAFRTALPDGDGKRYAVLVLLLPSMLYWPSSIGKESWLVLFVGVTALGAARLFTLRRGAFFLLAIGAVGTALIRPHIAVLLFAGLSVAQLLRPTGNQSTDLLRKVGGVIVMGGAAVVLTSQSATFLGIDDLNWQAVSEKIDWASGQATQGGSTFVPVSLWSPLGVPVAIITVLFRPFPWEAGNVQVLLQSLEGIILLVLTVKAWPRARRVLAIMRTTPYVVFAAVYSSGFILAFAEFGNFGILARQRVLMLPFFLILLALPAVDQVSRAIPERDLDDARR